MSDLATRVQNATAPQRATTGTAGLVESMGPQFARALPAHIPAERFTRLALTTLRTNPELAKCDPQSFLGALMTCAQLGLEPNTPTGEAYLVPFKGEVAFIPGYQGLVKLAWQSGAISEVYAEVVHEKDVFTFRKGLNRDLVHEPHLGDDAGKIIGAYAVVRMTDGGVAFDYWTIEQIRRHQAAHSRSRGGSKIADTANWMDRKVVLRQVLKLVPKSTNVNVALANDGHVRRDLAFDAIDVIDEHDTVEAELVDMETGEVTS